MGQDDTFKAAELLEEIIRHADPVSAYRRQLDPSSTMVGVRVLCEPDGKVTATYPYRVSTIMKGLEGTPEEVVEWLRTGLQEGQKVHMEEMDGEKHIVLVQEFYDPDLADHMMDLFFKHSKGRISTWPPEPRTPDA